MSTVMEKKPTKAKKSKAIGVIERLVTQGDEPGFAAIDGDLIDVLVTRAVRHPDNRFPAEASILAVMASLQSEGQIEPIVVRPGGVDSCGHTWQVISGETRMIAAHRLGWKSIKARVALLDDAAALRVLAAANAARQDLDPIATAKLIVRLCDPIEAGGSAMTREEAAKMFDLKSGGSASNLVRLLDLPATWLDRVASGELAQSYARELLRLVPLGLDSSAWGELEKSWKAHRADESDWRGEAWRSRDDLRVEIDERVEGSTRPVDKGDTHDFYEQTNSYERHPIRFKLTPELEQELRIVEIDIGDGQVRRRATNCKLYDAWQIPAIKNLMAKKNAGKSDESEDLLKEKTAKLTPKQQAAEDARRREKAAEALAKRIELWRAAWLRELVAAAIVDERWGDLCVRLLVWQQHRVTQIDHCSRETLHLPEQIKALYGRDILRAKGMGDVSSVIVQWLRLEPRDGYSHPMPDDFVEDIVDLMGIDLADAWLMMQVSGTRPARMQEFFELHNSEQLDAMGAELEVGPAYVAKKAGKVGAFMNAPKTLKLPKALRSLRKRGAR